jgi:hypothetical protein
MVIIALCGLYLAGLTQARGREPHVTVHFSTYPSWCESLGVAVIPGAPLDRGAGEERTPSPPEVWNLKHEGQECEHDHR